MIVPCLQELGVDLCVCLCVPMCAYVCACVPAKLLMLYHQSLQPDGELYITTTDHILNFELCEFGLHGLDRAHIHTPIIINSLNNQW